jgi:DNA damage-binding protein 1
MHALFFNRRIAYQEASQTFGVISMRTDMAEGVSGVTPGLGRPSASTQAQSISSSSTSKPLGASAPSTADVADQAFAEEVEVHSLLVIDQHTFEGEGTISHQNNK